MGKEAEERREINAHLWKRHGQYAGTGSTLNRHVEHENLHARSEGGLAGDPLHRHHVEGKASTYIVEEEGK